MKPIYINMHAHSAGNEQVWALQSLLANEQAPANSPFSAGLHPWFLEGAESHWELLRALAQRPNCLAIGECGLDRLKGPALDVQLHWLERQCVLAEQLNKPLVVHCVRAFDALLSFLKANRPSVPVIVHGFAQSPQILADLERYRAIPSFGLALLKSPKARQSLQAAKAFFLETDTEPVGRMADVYICAAGLLGMSLDDLQARQKAQWEALFGK